MTSAAGPSFVATCTEEMRRFFLADGTARSRLQPFIDLSKMVAAGDFREDLFYRINVIPVKLPPLRERQDDVQALAEHFVEKYAAQMKKELHGISGAAMTLLRSYPVKDAAPTLTLFAAPRGGASAPCGGPAR